MVCIHLHRRHLITDHMSILATRSDQPWVTYTTINTLFSISLVYLFLNLIIKCNWILLTFQLVGTSQRKLIKTTGIWPTDLDFPMFATGVRIFQNRPPLWLTIGLGNRSSGIYMQNSTNTTVNQWHNSWWGPTMLVHSIRLFFRNQGNRQ